MSATPTVLIVSTADVSPRLRDTVLWRSGVHRVVVRETGLARQKVRDARPCLVVVDGSDPLAGDFIRGLRADPETRRLSISALVDDPSAEDEARLRSAGANVVLAGQPIPFLWDRWLEELLSVPPRREVRIPVRIEVWQRRVDDPGARLGWTLNISTRGFLLETGEDLHVGTTFDAYFRMPGDEHTIHAVAQVVRQQPGPDGAPRSGVKLLRLADEDVHRIAAFVQGGTDH